MKGINLTHRKNKTMNEDIKEETKGYGIKYRSLGATGGAASRAKNDFKTRVLPTKQIRVEQMDSQVQQWHSHPSFRGKLKKTKSGNKKRLVSSISESRTTTEPRG